jgi:hypothetical protein
MTRRFLCVCQWGHSRSVAAARALHYAEQSAIACGWQTAGDGLPVLCDWATDILILSDEFREKIPEAYRHKITSLHVGHDVWANPYHPELFAIVKGLLERAFGLTITVR